MTESPVPLPVSSVLLAELVACPGPPGQEDAVRAAVASYVTRLGLPSSTDARGNLLVPLGERALEKPRIVVTAHLDEIALMATDIDADGGLSVSPLGGVYPWKWGEGPVEILAGTTRKPTMLAGVLSFGGIHTNSPLSAAQQSRDGRALTWDMARVLTGLSPQALAKAGVRPGSRVIMARQRRTLWPLGSDLIASYFLDDRADIVAWLLALAELRQDSAFEDVLFVATASEEVGGLGALYLLRERPAEIVIALEIGPTTPDNPLALTPDPTFWISDSYASMIPTDIAMAESCARKLNFTPRFQALTRGGSDASCAAAQGLCARPITLAFAADNSHGFEIMHKDAPEALAKLLIAILHKVA
jgi:putative aminopeptidase FrvX